MDGYATYREQLQIVTGLANEAADIDKRIESYFAHADRLIVVADDDQRVAELRQLVNQPQFKVQFQGLLVQLGGIQVVNLARAQRRQTPPVEFIPFVRSTYVKFLSPAARELVVA